MQLSVKVQAAAVGTNQLVAWMGQLRQLIKSSFNVLNICRGLQLQLREVKASYTATGEKPPGEKLS